MHPEAYASEARNNFLLYLEFFVKLDVAINDRMNHNATWKRLVSIFCDLPYGAEALDVRIQVILGRNDTSQSPLASSPCKELVWPLEAKTAVMRPLCAALLRWNGFVWDPNTPLIDN